MFIVKDTNDFQRTMESLNAVLEGNLQERARIVNGELVFSGLRQMSLDEIEHQYPGDTPVTAIRVVAYNFPNGPSVYVRLKEYRSARSIYRWTLEGEDLEYEDKAWDGDDVSEAWIPVPNEVKLAVAILLKLIAKRAAAELAEQSVS